MDHLAAGDLLCTVTARRDTVLATHNAPAAILQLYPLHAADSVSQSPWSPYGMWYALACLDPGALESGGL